MDAIVYVSESGFTKHYAELLSEKTFLPVYDLKDAKKYLARGSKIVFMGWMLAGFIQGQKKAKSYFNVQMVCAVGMSDPGMHTLESIIIQNKLGTIPVVYLQGGFNSNNLHRFHRFMINSMKKVLQRQLEAKPEKTSAEIAYLTMLKNGGDYVNAENLAPVIMFLSDCHD